MEEGHRSTSSEAQVGSEEGNILTAEDHKFWEDNGYLVIHNAVPKENLEATINAIFSFLRMDKDDPDDWYHAPLERNGFVQMYHHQTFWDNRQHPHLYKIFCELWDTHKLWVSIDRGCMKPPYSARHPDWTSKGFVHWDLDPWAEDLPFGIQGVLCLADTTPQQGGFHCIPGMHKKLKTWIKQHKPKPKEREKFNHLGIPIRIPERALKKEKLHVVDAKAGDLIVWRREIAHGNGFNRTQLPRLAQYITYYPARANDDQRRLTPQESLDPDGRNERIRLWKNNLAPSKFGSFKDPAGQPAVLTELGRKLLGLDLWEEEEWEEDHEPCENIDGGEKEKDK